MFFEVIVLSRKKNSILHKNKDKSSELTILDFILAILFFICYVFMFAGAVWFLMGNSL